MGVKERREYSREHKIEAVRKVLIDDRTTKDVGAEMDVSPSVLSRCVKEFTEDEPETFPGKGKRKSKDQELFELKRELQGFREERDILKKPSPFSADTRDDISTDR